MKFFHLKITGILLGGFLFFWAGSAQALVSLEHYEKMKMQKEQKTQGPEKVQSQAPIKVKVTRPGEGRPTPGKAGQK